MIRALLREMNKTENDVDPRQEEEGLAGNMAAQDDIEMVLKQTF